jgi:hypothetical protein
LLIYPLIVSIVLFSTIAYPLAMHKKLVSQYRDSEEGLIKP